jgi:hypothetical protein
MGLFRRNELRQETQFFPRAAAASEIPREVRIGVRILRGIGELEICNPQAAGLLASDVGSLAQAVQVVNTVLEQDMAQVGWIARGALVMMATAWEVSGTPGRVQPVIATAAS